MSGDVTHYLPAYTEVNGRQQKAACGRWIRAQEHSNEPTCDGCHAYVESEAATAHLTAEDVFGGPPDPATTVKHVPFDTLAGYRPRGSR